MKPQYRFAVALLASAVFHGLVLSGPDLDFLGRNQALAVDSLQARLMPAVARRDLPAKPSKPPVPRAGRVEKSETVPVELPAQGKPEPAIAEPEPVAAPAQTAATVAPADAEPAAVPEISAIAGIPGAMPTQLKIHYRITMGGKGMVVGEAIYDWQQAESYYTLRSVTRTVGLAAMFKATTVTHVSEGNVDGKIGLRPESFRSERNGTAGDWARFDWTTNQVTMSGVNEVKSVPVGAQDMVSVFLQLMLLPGDQPLLVVPVVTGKKMELYYFERVGRDTVNDGTGTIRNMIHYRTRRGQTETTEVWLDENGRFPVKIRHIDQRGGIFEQVAESIEINGYPEGAH